MERGKGKKENEEKEYTQIYLRNDFIDFLGNFHNLEEGYSA